MCISPIFLINCINQNVFCNISVDGFGDLVVSMLTSGTRVRGFNPGPKPLDFFRCGKNPQACLPSEGK
jgi:hypothetical protein